MLVDVVLVELDCFGVELVQEVSSGFVRGFVLDEALDVDSGPFDEEGLELSLLCSLSVLFVLLFLCLFLLFLLFVFVKQSF